MHNQTSHTAAHGAPKVSHPDWRRIAADLTDIAPLLAGRDDLTVTVAPGAAGPAPGQFGVADKVIELDADVCFIGVDPATVKLTDMYDHHRYPCALGVFAHECAHAAHTRWQPGNWPGPVAGAAYMLEDLRIEAAQITRRPLDRVWLRSASLKLDVPDLRRTVPRALGLWQAATAAALCLGRVDAGTLSNTDYGVDAARTALQDALGRGLYGELEALWRQALTVADTDAAAMHAIGTAWCRHLTAPATVLAAASDERQQQLAEATHLAAEVLADAAVPTLIAGGGTSSIQPSEPPPSDLFAYTAPPKRTRPPTGAEKATAARLARALAEAARRPRTATTIDAETPPGRLNMRGALTGAAQRAAGAQVTAKPWKRTVRKRTPDPATRIGIALDVSASMDAFFAPATAAAWMLARAAKRTGGVAAAATFGERARTLIPPGKVPTGIPEPTIEYQTNHLNVVIDALDAALDLGVPDQHARLLFMITDGYLSGQRWTVLDQCEQLQQAGCAIVQITPDLRGGMGACRIIVVEDPVTSIKVITDAVTAELRDAARREH